jgi:predicted nucleic acid-binding protein
VSYLLDTSILGRLANAADHQHATALHAVLELHRRGETLHLAPQNLIEFRNVATRPAAANGLGLSSTEAEAKSAVFEAAFPVLAEDPAIFPRWKAIVSALGVVGKQVHDARLVAVCHVNIVTHLLTFNTGHFLRLATFAPGIQVIDPAAV